MSADEAEILAAEAFAFLAADPARVVPFLETSGLDVADVRAQAGSREFLTSVLDYVGRDESLLLVFAAETGRKPEQVMLAAHVLSGNIPS
jgi:hypothetical protein